MAVKKKIVKKKAVKKKFVKKKTIVKKSVHTLVEDIHIPKDYRLDREGITQSFLGSALCCPQRFLFQINRWVKIGNEAVFEFGNIYHEMLDQAFTAKRAPSNRVLKKRLDKYAEIREKELSVQALETFAEKLLLAEMILQEYFLHYPEDFTEKRVLKAEQLFEVEFHGCILRGKKDLRFEYLKKRGIWLMEHKTKGRVDADILEGVLNFDLQNNFYILVDDIEYDQNVKNVLYNIIRNPGHKKKASETFNDYVERIREGIKKDPAHFFIRYECPYTLKTKKRFKEQLKTKLDMVRKFVHGGVPIYMNECACKMPYRCAYLEACASGNMVGYTQQKELFPELSDSIYK